MKYLNVLFVMMAMIAFACGDDDVENPNPPNEEEVITTVTLTFTPATGPVITATWKDEDGDGGNPPSQKDEIILDDATTYDMTVTFLNESDPTDVEDITEEIDEEDDEHQVFYTGTAIGTIADYAYGDMDDNMNPVGLSGTLTTTATGTGKFTVTLKHQPGVKSATSGITDGDTDVEVEFDMTVQ